MSTYLGILPTTRDGMRHVEHVMGMPVMFDVCDPEVGVDALEEAVRWLHWVDATFSTYRPESEISRLNRGELAPSDLHPEVNAVLDRCAELREETDGYFDIEAPYRAGAEAPAAGRGRTGSIEPSGLVKGWAVARAAAILRDAGAVNFLINASGDIHAAGHPDCDRVWRIGIQHPLHAHEVAIVLGLRDLAMATTGTQARGEHLVDPFDGTAPQGLLSVTLVGPDIATVDAYATAAYAMGANRAADWCARLHGYEAVLIREDHTVLTTPGIAGLRV